MQERQACALLKARFEAAGFRIVENVMFDEDGIRFEIDGFDADARVGYEYTTEEMGDSWDVDDDVQNQLAERRAAGTLFVLVVTETDAPDAATIRQRADAFLAELGGRNGAKPKRSAKTPDAKPEGASPPAAKPPAAAKPAAAKPAAAKPPAAKPPAARPPATPKPKPAAKKRASK